MKKTYRTRNWGTDIDVFDVAKETDATIWIKGFFEKEGNKTLEEREKKLGFMIQDN